MGRGSSLWRSPLVSSGGIAAQALRPHGAPSSPCSFLPGPRARAGAHSLWLPTAFHGGRSVCLSFHVGSGDDPSVVVASTVSVPRLRVVMAGSAVLLLSLGTVTYHQAATWHDTPALATQMLRVSPGNGMSEPTAGDTWLAAGDFERAATHLQRAVEVGPPSSVPFYSFELGLVKHLQGRLGEAAEWYRKATPSTGVVPGAQNNLGCLC